MNRSTTKTVSPSKKKQPSRRSATTPRGATPKSLPKPSTRPRAKERTRLVATFPALDELRPGVINRELWRPERSADYTWERTRQEVLQRDGHTCRFCGHRATKWMHVHHLVESGDDALANLATVCVACHAVLHVGRNLSLGTVEIWKSDVPQVEIVRRTREAIRQGRTLDDVKRELGVQRGPLAPTSTTYANCLIDTMGDAPRAALPKPLAAVFVKFSRWQLDD